MFIGGSRRAAGEAELAQGEVGPAGGGEEKQQGVGGERDGGEHPGDDGVEDANCYSIYSARLTAK